MNWADEVIPALDGISPKEAIKTADGREAVAALLLDAEKRDDRDSFTAEANRKGIRLVRELLGLYEEGD